MKKISCLITLSLLILLSACGDKNEEKKKVPGMKCGAGKCGANMFDGSAALVKKKKNILNQMREDDPRKDCVKTSKTTKKLYDCVRDPKGKKMILKCGSGKCGADMKDAKPNPNMKCGSGKCGSSMK